MPIVNGAYVAPTWNNDAPPAINAAELQDICDTLETYNTSKANISYVNTFVRPNLLDNWYFVGGGSQQGGGQLPINQGVSTGPFTTNGDYGIDRWVNRVSTSGSNVTVASDGLKFVSQSSGIYGMTQPLENKGQYSGLTLTISALLKDVTITSGSDFRLGIVSADAIHHHSAFHGYVQITGSGLYFKTITIDPTYLSQYPYLSAALYTNNTVVSATLAAVKLEVGDSQTLAHQENGQWVLNDMPKFEEELAKCQRFDYWMRNTQSGNLIALEGPVLKGSTRYMNGPLYTPVPMRTNPSVSHASCRAYRALTGSYTSIADSANFSSSGMAGNALSMSVQADSTMTEGESVMITISQNGYIRFDANIR